MFLIVICLEAVRRYQREFDRSIIREWQKTSQANGDGGEKSVELGSGGVTRPLNFRPTMVQQAIRSLLYMIQFAAAYAPLILLIL